MKYKILFFSFLCLCFLPHNLVWSQAPAPTIRAVVNHGYWMDASTWDQNRVPNDEDMVYIDRPIRMRGTSAIVRGLTITPTGQLRGRSLYFPGRITATDYFDNQGRVGPDMRTAETRGAIEHVGIIDPTLVLRIGPIVTSSTTVFDTAVALGSDVEWWGDLVTHDSFQVNGKNIVATSSLMQFNDVIGELSVTGPNSITINGREGESVLVEGVVAPDSAVTFTAPMVRLGGDVSASSTLISGRVQMVKTGLEFLGDLEISASGQLYGEPVWVRHATVFNSDVVNRGTFGPYIYPWVSSNFANLGIYKGEEIRLAGNGDRQIIGDFPTTVELHGNQRWMTSPTVFTYDSKGYTLTLPEEVTLTTTNISQPARIEGTGRVVVVDPKGDEAYSPDIHEIVGDNIRVVLEASAVRLSDNITAQSIEIRDRVLASNDLELKANQVAFVGGSLSGWGTTRQYEVVIDTPDLSGSGHLGPFTDFRLHTDIPSGFTAGWNTGVYLEQKGAGWQGKYRLAGGIAGFLSDILSIVTDIQQPNLAGALNTGEPHYYSYETNRGWSSVLSLNTQANPFTQSSGIAKREFYNFSFIPNQEISESVSVTITTPSDPSHSGTVRLVATRGEVYPSTVTLVDGLWRGDVVLFDSGGGQQIIAQGVGSYVAHSGRSNFFHVVDPNEKVGQIQGVVRNGDGSRASNGEVVITNVTTLEQSSVGIDSDGQYESSLLSGTYLVETVNGLGQTITLGPDQVVEHDLVLNRTCDVSSKIPVLLVPGIEGSDVIGETGWFPRLTKYAPAWDANVLEIHNPSGLGGIISDPGGWNDMKILLAQNGYEENCNVFDVPYDWSLAVPDIAEQYLKPWIDHVKKTASTTQVDIVAHSMGGLVSRSYIQSNEYENDVRKLAMVGTPNLGSAMSYFSWEGGDPVAADRFAGLQSPLLAGLFQSTTISLNHQIKTEEQVPLCTSGLWGTFTGAITCDQERTKQFLWDYAPAVGNLYPTYDFLFSENSEGQFDSVQPTFTNTFLEELNSSGISTTTEIKLFVGTGFDTVRNIYIDQTEKGDSIYTDGKVMYTSTTDGDGTVTSESVRWNEQVKFYSDSDFLRQEKHVSLIGLFKDQILFFLNNDYEKK